MAILVAGVMRRDGGIVFARQFVGLRWAIVESLLQAFPRLVDPKQQHTIVEGDHVRYVYLPLESLFYLVLICTRSSNIIADIQTLHLVSGTISDICRPGIDADVLREKVFELINALDEIIVPSFGSQNTSVMSTMQVLNNLKMDSQAEKIEEMLTKDKEKEAKAKAKEKIRQLEQQKKEAAKLQQQAQMMASQPVGMNFGKSNTGQNYYPGSMGSRDTDSTGGRIEEKSAPRGGMRLSSKKADASTLLAGMAKSTSHNAMGGSNDLSPAKKQSTNERVSDLAPGVETNIQLQAEEHISLVAHHDGGIDQFEVKGDLNVFVPTESLSFPCFQLSLNPRKEFQYKTHPNIDRSAFSDQCILRAKDQQKAFPLCQNLAVLKWRFVSTDESDLPILINCWPSQNTYNGVDVIVEYQLEKHHTVWDLVQISIPIPPNTNAPEIKSLNECGCTEYDREHDMLHWIIPDVSSPGPNQNGTLEFSITGRGTSIPVDAFFPLSIHIKSTTSTYCPIDIMQSCSIKDPSLLLPYSLSKHCISDEYTIL
jgi:hypothetical protein